MARYPSSSSYRRRKRLTRAYIIAASVVAVIIVLFYIFNPFGKGNSQIVEPLNQVNVAPEPKPETVTVEPPPKAVEPPPEPNLPEESPDFASEPNSQVAELVERAMACIKATPPRITEARDILNEALPISMNTQQRAFIKGQLSQLANEWLFSRTIYPQDSLCGGYKVKPGQLLSIIGKNHKVPYEILMDINKIPRAEALQAGTTIKIINGPFHARIYLSTFTMDLFLQNTFVRSFNVGLGKPGMETPTGLWLVKPGGKLIKPRWTDPTTGRTFEPEDPDYPLGSRWIALEGTKGNSVGRTGFAIHGTKDPQEIGKAASQGCIRLHNGEAILVYNLLMPGFSQVEVVD